MLLAVLPVLYIASRVPTLVQLPGSFLAGASVYLTSSGLVLLDLVGLSAGLSVKDGVDILHTVLEQSRDTVCCHCSSK